MDSKPELAPCLERVPVRARRYEQSDEAQWDSFVTAAPTGTFLHSRQFLSYHGARFKDCSLVFQGPGDRICAVLPAAADPDDATVAISHPGATYGGLLLSDYQYGLDASEILELAGQSLAASGFRRLIYKCVPPHVHRGTRQADIYALWRMGGRLIRRDLWNVIDLTRPREVEAARRRRLRRARDHGVKVAKDGSARAYADFYRVLVECLAQRHGVRPVHSLQEMQLLQSRFDAQISLWLARDEAGDCVAGEWIFDLGDTCHGQYGVTTPAGREMSAQDLLLETILGDSASRGVRNFSFGTSTEAEGKFLNEGLYRYKASFGAGAVVHDFYELGLAAEKRDGPHKDE
jgi:hypothetical protein